MPRKTSRIAPDWWDYTTLESDQNARTSGGGNITMVPRKAIAVGTRETWKASKVSIWHAGMHDNPLGQRLTAVMISKGNADSSVPMSLLADHPNVKLAITAAGWEAARWKCTAPRNLPAPASFSLRNQMPKDNTPHE